MQTWIETGALPSDGKVYDIAARFRPYTFGELRVISQSQMTQHEMVNVMLDGIDTGKMNKADLTLSDFLYIALLRKLYTLGESATYTVTRPCSCGTLASRIIEPLDFVFSDLTEPFPMVMPHGDKQLTVSPVTLAQYIDNINADSFDMIAMSCGLSKDTIFNSEHTADLTAIEAATHHSIEPIPLKCSECGTTNSVNLLLLGKDGTCSLVYPFRKSEAVAKKGVFARAFLSLRAKLIR